MAPFRSAHQNVAVLLIATVEQLTGKPEVNCSI